MPKQTFYNLDNTKQQRIIKASLDEFSQKIYEQVNLSDIIKKSDIPRGSFYQYFEDKKDLYFYLIEIIKQTKLEYLTDAFNRSDLKFLDLVEKLYNLGVIFAIDHPKYVMVFDKLLHNQNDIYEELMKENMSFAIDYYANLIKKDQSLGLLRKDIHAQTLAKMISELTTNVTINDLDITNPKQSYIKMTENIHHILDILRKGVENNE